MHHHVSRSPNVPVAGIACVLLVWALTPLVSLAQAIGGETVPGRNPVGGGGAGGGANDDAPETTPTTGGSGGGSSNVGSGVPDGTREVTGGGGNAGGEIGGGSQPPTDPPEEEDTTPPAVEEYTLTPDLIRPGAETTLHVTLTEAASVAWSISHEGMEVYACATGAITTEHTCTWNGTTAEGLVAIDGVYTVSITAKDAAANIATYELGVVRVDGTPPSTTATVTCTYGARPYNETCTVVLDAQDNVGVATTRYRIGDTADWSTYASARVFSSLLWHGTYRMHYYSVDVAGNEESPKYVDVTIRSLYDRVQALYDMLHALPDPRAQAPAHIVELLLREHFWDNDNMLNERYIFVVQILLRNASRSLADITGSEDAQNELSFIQQHI